MPLPIADKENFEPCRHAVVPPAIPRMNASGTCTARKVVVRDNRLAGASSTPALTKASNVYLLYLLLPI